MLFHHNTFAGFDSYGRANVLYNETVGTLRTHTLPSSKGNIWLALATKHDDFYGVNLSDPDGTAHLRVGGWPFYYGVGCDGDVTQYMTSSPMFAQTFPGIHVITGTSETTPVSNINFTNNKATTSGPVAGAGQGNYQITAGSVVAALLPIPVLPFDLAGVARHSSNTAAGAYELNP